MAVRSNRKTTSKRRPAAKRKASTLRSSPEKLQPGVHRPLFEAPDWGFHEGEAPEMRRERKDEAPDWGEGRSQELTLEFTHGRSQS